MFYENNRLMLFKSVKNELRYRSLTTALFAGQVSDILHFAKVERKPLLFFAKILVLLFNRA